MFFALCLVSCLAKRSERFTAATGFPQSLKKAAAVSALADPIDLNVTAITGHYATTPPRKPYIRLNSSPKGPVAAYKYSGICSRRNIRWTERLMTQNTKVALRLARGFLDPVGLVPHEGGPGFVSS